MDGKVIRIQISGAACNILLDAIASKDYTKYEDITLLQEVKAIRRQLEKHMRANRIPVLPQFVETITTVNLSSGTELATLTKQQLTHPVQYKNIYLRVGIDKMAPIEILEFMRYIKALPLAECLKLTERDKKLSMFYEFYFFYTVTNTDDSKFIDLIPGYLSVLFEHANTVPS